MNKDEDEKNFMDYLTPFIFPLIIAFFVVLIWLGVKFDLGDPMYDGEGNPNIDISKQYGGR